MRIPPAVAKEIGSYYAAAQVNDSAARRLADSGEYITSALDFLARGDVDAAVSDACSAASLLERFTTNTDDRLDRGALSFAKQAYTDAAEAARLLESGQGAGNLRGAAGRASDAQARATQAAASWRRAADALAAEYM